MGREAKVGYSAALGAMKPLSLSLRLVLTDPDSAEFGFHIDRDEISDLLRACPPQNSAMAWIRLGGAACQTDRQAGTRNGGGGGGSRRMVGLNRVVSSSLVRRGRRDVAP